MDGAAAGQPDRERVFVAVAEAQQPRAAAAREKLARLVRKAVVRKRARVIYPRIYWLARWFPGRTRFVTDRLTPRLPRQGKPSA